MIGLGLTSPSTIHEHLKTLANKGILTYNPGKSRTIELLVPNEYLVDNQIVKIRIIDTDEYIIVPEFMLNSYDAKYILAYKQDKTLYLVNTKLLNIKDKKSLYKNKNAYIISNMETFTEIGTIISELIIY